MSLVSFSGREEFGQHNVTKRTHVYIVVMNKI